MASPRASGTYGRQETGIVGLATWMKIVACGAVGWFRSFLPGCDTERSPLRWLQPAQQATTFSQLVSPPFDLGITWSIVRDPRLPQYWHSHPSRANTARRVILRRNDWYGMRT